MWNNYHTLNSISRLLTGAVVIATLYGVSLHLVQPPFFPIKEIHIRTIPAGKDNSPQLQHVTGEQIDHLVRNELAGNFISVNLTAVREAFVKLPWVREAKINREWPHGLNVVLEEHRALAYWGDHALVNSYGEVFRVTVDMDLPTFTGPNEASALEVAQQYRRFNQILAPVDQKIAEINLTSRYAWRLRLDTGTILELGKYDIEDRLSRYVLVYNHSIARWSQHQPLAYVDLRYPNGFAIRAPAVPEQPRKSALKREA
ncbi:MAG: cell division protein FtsQ/DivIB [Nitrosomonas sp.]|nr:MAG: cell division protein FtsQ/DivIB [Nitrosomonas sp.]